ncbi:MAG: class I SAM-dependent methyltransferase [Cohaesibacter sp.]|jgi:2-polyprenyl-3-methyl-5-hydroxy-6-metoxy-1,4-benzoquinol methylase/ribosomal protein S27E|nr:class I SAM-dependent methyltransferase [Cohaesibacter sp.]
MDTPAVIKEEEIRPEDVFNEFMRLSAQDAESFFDKSQFVDVVCPGCGASEKADHFKKHSFQYNSCAKCGSVYVSPRPNLDELIRYYSVSKSQSFWSENVLKKTGEKRKQSIMLPNVSRIDEILEEKGHHPNRVVDIGSANGAFLTEWKKRHQEAELHGIEPGRESAQQCRNLGIEVYEASVEEVAQKKQVNGDLVTCFEVLEHVQDPELFAKSVYEVTAPGGMAILSTLGAEGFDIQVLWNESRSLMPPYHLNFLSCEGMKKLFSKSGFSKVEVFTPGRLDVEIVQNSIKRGASPDLSRFEKLLLSRGSETWKAFQKFLAENALSSHVWIVCSRD